MILLAAAAAVAQRLLSAAGSVLFLEDSLFTGTLPSDVLSTLPENFSPLNTTCKTANEAK